MALIVPGRTGWIVVGLDDLTASAEPRRMTTPAELESLEGRARLRPSAAWFLTLALVTVTGLVVSLFKAAPDVLAHQNSLSFLGIDQDAGLIFNVTAILTGFLFAGLARQLRASLRAAVTSGGLNPTIGRIITASLMAIPVAFVITGVFTISTQPTHAVHSLAGFVPPVLILFLMSGSATTAPGSARFDRISLITVVVVAALFAAAKFGTAVPYAGMEVVGLVVCGIWLWAAESRWRVLAET